jgi:uncharacterized cupredoxin-like copper-binding protein
MKKFNRAHTSIAFAALVAFGISIACTKGAGFGGTEDHPAAVETAGAPAWDPGHHAPAPSAHPGGTIDVTLHDFLIEMPHTITSGLTVFQVSNRGSQTHTFAVRTLDGIDHSLPQPLEPGQRGSVSANLAPGNYTVVCPIADHADRGMLGQFTVVEPPADAKAH